MSRLISFVFEWFELWAKRRKRELQNENILPTVGIESNISRLLDWHSNRLCYRDSWIMHFNIKIIQYVNSFAIDHCRFISHHEHNVIRDNIHSARAELYIYIVVWRRSRNFRQEVQPSEKKIWQEKKGGEGGRFSILFCISKYNWAIKSAFKTIITFS